MTETNHIPLNKLIAWDGNVRKTDADAGIGELAASIAAHGLLQSLVVRKHTRGKFAVVAGRRRLLALKALAESGGVLVDMPVSCTVIDGDANATEISLAENAVREPMHPADEFDAFLALTESGMPLADIAARFGVSDTVVNRRLRLARVCPAVIAAYRNDVLSLEQVMAFAVSDDHAAQECVLAHIGRRNEEPEDIRDALTEGEISAADRRVGFVTLSAYEAAGGAVRRDLFSDDEDGVFILDVPLLDRLVMEKLAVIAEAVRGEGWKWVEICATFDHAEWSHCRRCYAEPVPLSDDEEAELQSLEEEQGRLYEAEDLDAEANARLDVIENRIRELEDRLEVWTPEILAIAGAVVTLGHDSEPDVRRGLMLPQDMPEETGEPREAGDDTAELPESRPAFSASLIESLTAHRSAALTAALMDRPDVALAATVHAMALRVFSSYPGGTCLDLSVSQRSLRRVEGSPAHQRIEAAHRTWGDQIPGNPEAFFAWCLEQDRDRLLDLLAFCAARIVDAVQEKKDNPASGRFGHASALAEALGLDMAAWFTPTAENYFARISKPQILDALREIRGSTAPAWDRMKKAELAALAERELAGTGWLPEPLRRSSHAGLSADDSFADAA